MSCQSVRASTRPSPAVSSSERLEEELKLGLRHECEEVNRSIRRWSTSGFALLIIRRARRGERPTAAERADVGRAERAVAVAVEHRERRLKLVALSIRQLRDSAARYAFSAPSP